MGSFDDMLAKTEKRDKDRSKKAAVQPLPASSEDSLAQQMFGGVAGLFKSDEEKAAEEAEAQAAAAEAQETAAKSAATAAATREVADIDARAQTGELSFNDFLTMSEAFTGLGGDKQMPGMPTLSAKQMLETREKFEKHAKICEVMLDDERADPSILMEDLKSGAATSGPRIQRLAQASGQPETEVGLFLMQFEAMRESTRRIAAGEDPDEVNDSMSAPPGANRAARRAASKKAAKAKSKGK